MKEREELLAQMYTAETDISEDTDQEARDEEALENE